MRRAVSTVVAAMLVLAVSCGHVPETGQVASPSPVQTPPDASPTPTWNTYSDTDYGFSLSVPADFTVQKEGPGAGAVQAYRAFQPQHTNNGYPEGQVEFAIYAKDASTLTAWVNMHTGTPSPTSNPYIYWPKTSNISSTTVAGRDAIYFDVDEGSGFPPVHTVAFFWNSSYVFRLDYWSSDAKYAATIEPIGNQMLNSFKG